MLVEKINQTALVDKVGSIDTVDRVDLAKQKISTDKKEISFSLEDSMEDKEKVTLKEAVEKLNKALEIFNVERRFEIDDKTKELVIKIIDRETGEVVDQIPPEEALKRYYEMQRFIGLLFNKRV